MMMMMCDDVSAVVYMFIKTTSAPSSSSSYATRSGLETGNGDTLVITVSAYHFCLTPNLNFVASPVPEKLSGTKILNVGHASFDLILHFFPLYSLCANRTPNLKFVSSIVSDIMIDGVPKVEGRSHDLDHASFVPEFYNLCKYNLFDILVKFCDDSFIRRQEIRGNTVHWFKLEVLHKKAVLRV